MTNDIVSLHRQINKNIIKFENNFSKNLLLQIKTDFLKLLELIKLFLISERNTYYGYFLMNMEFQVNLEKDSYAGIKLNTFPPVFSANPLNLCKLSLKEIMYVFCHEIDHIVFNHPAEMVRLNPQKSEDLYYKFNLAADAAVNDRLNNEIQSGDSFLKTPDGVITSSSIKEMFNLQYLAPLESYAYYYNEIKNLKLKKEQSTPQQNEASQNDEANNNQNSAWQNATSQNDEGNNLKNNLRQNEKPKIMENHNWDGGDVSFDISDLVKEFVNSTYSMMNQETRGLMPASFIEQIELINKPAKLSWQQILKKYVGTIVAGKRKTRTRLSRRQPERFDIPGRVDEKIIKIVVAIDTSGSVSDEQIAEIFNEIFAIIATRKKEITVIECDAKIQKVYKAKNQTDISKKVLGRGGTAFTPVINYINEHKYFKDALLIYFTDGCGENKIPKPLTYRNIWVLTKSIDLSVKKPYGIVLNMD